MDGERGAAELTRGLIQGDDQGLKCIKCLQLPLSVRVQVLEQDGQPLLDDGGVHAAAAVLICRREQEEQPVNQRAAPLGVGGGGVRSPFTAALHTAVIRALRKGAELI